MSNDRVAVVTRTRQRPLLLGRAIQSVLAQTHGDWLHVIVNDGGDPAPVERAVQRHANEYAGRAQVLHLPASAGMEAASNAGIAASESRWLAIHDDDDTWHPDFLARTLAAIRAAPDPDCAGAIAWTERVEERIEGETVREIRRESYNGGLVCVELWALLKENLYPPISFLFARAALAEIGGFDPALPVLGDWDFNLRFCARYEVAVVAEHLARYHLRPAGTTGAYANTVVDGAARHAEYRARLVNRWLRRDLAAGRVGLGTLAAMAGDLHALRRRAQLPGRAARAARKRLLRLLMP